ncbi:hypothetical protein N7456_000915 [Penicillium angulare]|uniref:Oligopeptide transporter OPT superfamily n=1 Tax=Penicillium angulare TaxID=116970 RepID=A0A9W9KRD0_9EURO|nr:hypothetical protein N7456_000915 [Penicillium angulare]
MESPISPLPAERQGAPSGDDNIVDEKKTGLVESHTNIIQDEVVAGKSQSNVEIEAKDSDIIIVTGADAAAHLMPMRDDFDSALTFRGILLASCLACFQAVMNQIYQFKPSNVDIQGTFIVVISYFLGRAWTSILPRGDHLENRWRENGGSGRLPWWIRLFKIVNHGEWSLKEHAICSITATSASNASSTSAVWAAQKLFYDMPLSATTVILAMLSIGLFGYGLCGMARPIAVWHPEAVYWTNIPTVKTLQGLHWDRIKGSKPMRYFWYTFTGMTIYELIPIYMFPWLNSVSIPCLASQKAKGETANVLTNIFGGATNNEGLGIFSLSFDWQFIQSSTTAQPLKTQLHQALGYFTCLIAMLGVYYGNGWGSRSLPFMSTHLLNANGTKYPVNKLFPGGVLDKSVLAENGPPKLTGAFAYAMLMANAAIGALIVHCILFWGKDVRLAYRNAKKKHSDDPHHAYMVKHYNETPFWWYAILLLFSFLLGIVVALKENITLPAWGYVVSLVAGSIVAPFSIILYSRFGNGIATNNLSKMLAGLMLPGKPVGNMYFAAWSHNVISNSINLSSGLKMGEYLKIPPRAMFLTQIYGTILGGFINYAVMISIVNNKRDLLISGNGSASWSGVTIQSYNTNAASWALAPYLYKAGSQYEMVPVGIAFGAAAVLIHWAIYKIFPKIRGFDLAEINISQFCQYAGYIPYNQTQTCMIFSIIISGFYVQYYLRNYRPQIFKDYSYLVTGAMDGGTLLVLFVLSFAVFGAGGDPHPFPTWWGNNVDGNYDWCPEGK